MKYFTSLFAAIFLASAAMAFDGVSNPNVLESNTDTPASMATEKFQGKHVEVVHSVVPMASAIRQVVTAAATITLDTRCSEVVITNKNTAVVFVLYGTGTATAANCDEIVNVAGAADVQGGRLAVSGYAGGALTIGFSGTGTKSVIVSQKLR